MNELGEMKQMENENTQKLNVLLEYLENGEEDPSERLNKLLKTLRNDNREVCFSLLNCFYLNRNFKYQNLKESLKDENGISNEYINVKILEKEIYPKDENYYKEEKRRKELYYKVHRIEQDLANKDEKLEQTCPLRHSDDKNAAKDKKQKNFLKGITAEEKDREKELLRSQTHNIWKADNVVGTYNPIYTAREKILNDDVMNAIPTVDIFYNSSKLLSIQTIFEPVSHYICLLRLLPHFCLPLYDSGILQFVCEDAYLNPKFKGLEISYRLLIHDILFFAFFSYLSDLPFWAKPPIELLRIYNYESLYSLNDWESVHTEKLVFHNIKNILFNFSDTLNKIELLYPKDYYITVFPNIYFKNIIEFLDSEHFRLKKIVVVIKGIKHIDKNMMKCFRMNLQNFKGMTTETLRKEKKEKISVNKMEPTENRKSTRHVIDAMKKCLTIDKMNSPKRNKESDIIQKADTQISFSTKKLKNTGAKIDTLSRTENSYLLPKRSENISENRENTYINSEEAKERNMHEEDGLINNRNSDTVDNKRKDDTCKIKNSITNTNCETLAEKQNSLDNIDLSNKYKMDQYLYSMYYNKKKEEGLLFNDDETENSIETENEGGNAKIKKDKDNDNSSDSSFSEDESDNENIDGFFRSKKLKTTVYDKKQFSLGQMMSNIINYEKIIDYLYNEDQHLYDANYKVKFYIKMLLFEKIHTTADDPETSINVDEPVNVQVPTNSMTERGGGEGTDSISPSARVSENADSTENNRSHEGGLRETTEFNTETDVADRLNFTFNNMLSEETSTSISNLIRNFRLSLENNNFLSFNIVNGETEEEPTREQDSFNFDSIQDSLTHITFNFN